MHKLMILIFVQQSEMYLYIHIDPEDVLQGPEVGRLYKSLSMHIEPQQAFLLEVLWVCTATGEYSHISVHAV